MLRISSRVLLLTLFATALSAAEMSLDEAWRAVPQYTAGQDMAPLLALDRAVIQAMATPATREACAARLAALAEEPSTTAAARQYLCLALRQAGTPAQVPALARLLTRPDAADSARQALEAIPGPASLAALRAALETAQGPLLVGVVNSLGARRDAGSVARLELLATAQDARLAAAAILALGHIGDTRATAFLSTLADRAGPPTPPGVAAALLRCAAATDAADTARAIYTRLSQSGQTPAVRRAALEGLLRLEKAPARATILAWFTGTDAQRRRVAAGHLATLSDAQFDELSARLAQLPADSIMVLLEVLPARKRTSMLPMVLAAVKSDQPELKLAGIRSLGALADSSTIPLLIDCLAAGGEVTAAAQEALVRLPRKAVIEAMLETLRARPAVRPAAIEVLARLRAFEAIDPLIELAANDDAEIYEPALVGLRRIADPDKFDLPRLVGLLLRTPAGERRDLVEKTILGVCQSLPPKADRAAPVLAALAQRKASDPALYLPLVGRLGGPSALKLVDTSLASPNPAVKQAAVRALCNWPTADVAPRLWTLASQPANPTFQQWALRAYVRVVTLKSDRSEAETLAMLQQAMRVAKSPDDKQWVLARAATVRSMATVAWVAPYLDDAELSETACRTLVELAHHRFLRHPNMDRFGPLLEKVGRLSKDPVVAERAKKYRLGL
jgi:HEAT repeat protein